MKKQIAILGLGIFGTTLAENLSESNCEVLVVDLDMERVEKVEQYVTHAVVADVTDFEALQALNIESFDIAVVAIGSSLEASILAVMYLKELGIPYVVAKTRNKTNRIILEKIGADRVIIPEKEVSQRLSKRILSHRIIDVIQFTDDYTIIEVLTPEKWVGQTIEMVAKLQSVRIVAIVSSSGNLILDMNGATQLKKDDVLVIISNNDSIENIDEIL